METFNNDPNFSIVMRGGCNAACAFCFNKSKNNAENKMTNFEWLLGIERTLHRLPSQFYQISITGGEPMISPVRDEVLTICKELKPRFTNILLTTNGTGLLTHIDNVCAGVHHINISRHHYDEEKNKAIFGGRFNVSNKELADIIDQYSARGVDVSLNCVIDDSTTYDFIMEYIEFAKSIGAYAVRFRKQNGDSLAPTPCESEVAEQYPILERGECPVCRTYLRVIHGLKTYWKAAVIEPTDKIKDKVYELVYDIDGNLYLDWNRNVPYAIQDEPVRPKRKVQYRVQESHTTCGWSNRGNRC